jgi:hypothetical protein
MSVTEQANPLGAVIPGVMTGLQVDEDAVKVPAIAPPAVAEVVQPELMTNFVPAATIALTSTKDAADMSTE